MAFDPLDFRGKLAALVPPPRFHLVLPHPRPCPSSPGPGLREAFEGFVFPGTDFWGYAGAVLGVGEARCGDKMPHLVRWPRSATREGNRKGWMCHTRLRRELEDALGRRVDLVPKDGLKPLIRDDVLAEAQVLYAA